MLMKAAHKSEKICPSCSQWTHWNNQLGDCCEHCGFDLLKAKVEEEQERKERFYEKPTGIISITGNEPAFLQGIYRIINFVYLIFVAMMAAIVWFITTVVA